MQQALLGRFSPDLGRSVPLAGRPTFEGVHTMYIADCSFRFSHNAGLTVRPAALDTDWHQGELRVSFKPLKYFPPEPDSGAGADFDARITRIEIRDIQDESGERAWHLLDPRDTATARTFLDAYYCEAMWDQAFDETAEAFGVETHARAA